jgi:hypothetical protein
MLRDLPPSLKSYGGQAARKSRGEVTAQVATARAGAGRVGPVCQPRPGPGRRTGPTGASRARARCDNQASLAT